ncbi:MAG: S1 RNA-binding domain-containing protein [Clostridia bacterium]|nr:S1 RNA-binding domain-containing protein [Clostridia bacterium]
MQLEVGSILEGKVTGITNFGAFVQINDSKITGLVHISEVSLDYVKDINEHLKVNDSVKVKVVSVAPGGKISLSIKKVQEEERALKASRPADVEMFTKPATTDLSFEDKINRFKSDSDERLQTLKRNFESKRGSYGGRRQSY